MNENPHPSSVNANDVKLAMFSHPKFVIVWPWDDAPEKLRALSGHGGDEDFVAFVPTGLSAYIPFLDHLSNFVSEHPIDGGVVYIGAHA